MSTMFPLCFVRFLKIAALTLVSIGAGAAGDPPEMGRMYAEGSISEAAEGFARICLAHPLSIIEQRRVATTPPLRFQRAVEATTIESYTQGLLQLSVAARPDGNLCAILTPFVDLPTLSAATRDVRAKLRFGPGTQKRDSMVWHRIVGGTVETVVLTFVRQGGNQGSILSLTAK